MIVNITTEEKNQIVRDTLDRIVYCNNYKEELMKLNSKYNPHKDVKYRYNSIQETLIIPQIIT